jgi:inhibitor of cysteine peptidase
MNMKTLFATIMVAAIATGAWAEELRFTDPAKPIEVAPGAEFVICLESNRTTGFGWDISEPIDEKVLSFVGSEYIAAETPLAGAGGRELWAFRAVGPGKAVVSFKYVRPWEKGVDPTKNASFTVVVRKSEQHS